MEAILLINMKEIYEIRADELMDVMLKNVHKGNYALRSPSYKSTTKISTFKITKLYKDKTVTIRDLERAGNLTLEELKYRKMKLDIKTLLDSHVTGLPNFESEDEITAQTRRFNRIQEQKNISSNGDLSVARDLRIDVRRRRIIQLMAQFVYRTRYELPYAQMLRKKYIKNSRYRIGYCFALLRHLKGQQMLMFTTMKNYNTRYMVLYAIVKLYEKVIKLDVDVRDLMKYIEHLDKERANEIKAKTSKKSKKALL